MYKNTRSYIQNLKKELNRRGYWSRKNKKNSQVLETKLKSCVTDHQQQLERTVATTKILANDLKKEILQLAQELIDSHKHRDHILETCTGIIMNLKSELARAQKSHIHEPRVHKLPVHQNQQEFSLMKDHEKQFMIIPIHEKQLSRKRLIFGLNPHKRKYTGISFSKRKKVRTKL